jgi:hypothetical protein
MKIIHRIALATTDADRLEVARLGLRALGTGRVPDAYMAFDVAESDREWPEVERWIRRRGMVSDVVRTEFTTTEIETARWLNLQPEWHFGYPQPEDSYIAATYDLSDYCRVCGVGKKQMKPFVMSGQPRWGSRSIVQLNWIFDEYFVRADEWSKALAPLGVRARPVVDLQGQEIPTVVQLVASECVDISTVSLEASACPACGRTRFLPLTRGFLPSLVSCPSSPLVRTAQYFGSGAEAHNEIIASHALAAAVRAAKMKGVSFRPVR